MNQQQPDEVVPRSVRDRKMRVFVFTFPALWLGGKAVVIAHDEEEARKLLHERFDKDSELKNVESRFATEEVAIAEQFLARTPQVVYYDNGNY